MTNKFKDTAGRWLTLSIFKGLPLRPSNYTPIFTVAEAKELYMECKDLTGYRFATEHLGGWQHWKALRQSPPVRAFLDEWEEELEVMIRAENLGIIMETAKTDKGFQAAKYMTDKGWKEKTKGRTTKDAIEREARVQSKVYSEFDNVIGMKKK